MTRVLYNRSMRRRRDRQTTCCTKPCLINAAGVHEMQKKRLRGIGSVTALAIQTESGESGISKVNKARHGRVAYFEIFDATLCQFGFGQGLRQRQIGQVHFSFLDLSHIELDGVVHDISRQFDCALLTESMNAICCLIFNSWIPKRLQKINSRCHGQIEPNTAGTKGHQEDFARWVCLEVLHGFIACISAHGSVEPPKLDVGLV